MGKYTGIFTKAKNKTNIVEHQRLLPFTKNSHLSDFSAFLYMGKGKNLGVVDIFL